MLSYRSALGPCTSSGLDGRGGDDPLRCGGVAQVTAHPLGPAALGPPQVLAVARGDDREALAECELLVFCGEEDCIIEEAEEALLECEGEEDVRCSCGREMPGLELVMG